MANDLDEIQGVAKGEVVPKKKRKKRKKIRKTRK